MKQDLSEVSSRRYPEETRPGDDRNDFQRDRDIILYSSALQRLSTTTQVATGELDHVFHNRLTHTLQVAQVGRRLAEKLVIKQPDLAAAHEVDADMVETACLAHDLGHPPFGHLAEESLNELIGEANGGFEGNAQSFRVVTELAFRDDRFNGLNLTRATLRSILKYPWTYAGRPSEKLNKWGAYDSECESFAFAIGTDGDGPFARSSGAELMDWADDLTYAIHDAEDFYRAGLIPLHLLLPPGPGSKGSAERDRFLAYVVAKKKQIEDLKDVSDDDFDQILGELLFTHFKLAGAYQGTRHDRARLRSFTSLLVGRYINGLHLVEPSANTRTTVKIDQDLRIQIALLKQLTWCYVIDGPGLAIQQHAHRHMIEYLFQAFLEDAHAGSRLLPPYYRERVQLASGEETAVRRIVVDLIAGMTEGQTVMTYRRLNGIVDGSALGRWVV